MKLFFQYLKSKKRTLAVLLLFVIIFAITFTLYRLPLFAVLYPAVICVLFGSVILIRDFIKTKKKHDSIQMLTHLSAEQANELPESENICEEDYKELVRTLQKEVLDTKQQAQSSYNDMVNYYTVWAHQIKTPISSMKLTLQNEDSELSRKLGVDIFRTQQYVEMVLAFLRLGSQSNDYLFKEYSIDEIIRPCIRKFSSEFIGRKLTLTYEPVNTKIITDEKWFSFVIEQILSNALKYTKDGGISIYVENGCKLCIEDTGMGIAPEDLPRIFEKGYTGYNGRTEKSASGLGLYLCKRICDNLGIKIDIRSQINKGTTVFLDISQNKPTIE